MCAHGLLGGEYSRALWCVSTLLKPLALCYFGDFSGFLPQLREDVFFPRLIKWCRSDHLDRIDTKLYVANWSSKTDSGIRLNVIKTAKQRNKQDRTCVKKSESLSLLPTHVGERGVVSWGHSTLTRGYEERSLFFSQPQANLRRSSGHAGPPDVFSLDYGLLLDLTWLPNR